MKSPHTRLLLRVGFLLVGGLRYGAGSAQGEQEEQEAQEESGTAVLSGQR